MATEAEKDFTPGETHENEPSSNPDEVLKLLKGKPKQLRGAFRLIAEKNALNWSLAAVRFGVLADAVSTTILQPNFPFLARAGSHPDSFDNTDPFGFSAATYFLPMTALFGAAITSAFIGGLSDRVGRRPCLLVCVGASVIGTIGKYMARETFWGFCAVNFINGLFGGALPVALAYVSDVHPNRHKKDDEIGVLVAFNMMGMSGGGIAAILMEDQGLFTPLFIGAAMNFIGTIFLYFCMIEADVDIHFEEEVDEDDDEAVEKINWTSFSNVIGGALLDNVGSTGLYPLTLSPLVFEIFLTDFLELGQKPIMSASEFKWIQVMVVLMVIPGAALSQPLFDRIGIPGGCVFGNMVTAVGILACMLIANIEPPTTGTLIGFVVFLYAIFPFTVLSQLSTGPMLDRLSPVERRGFAQGLNITVMNFANAVAPWLFGTFADAAGINTTLWTAIGISILAALVNLPLSFIPELKKKEHVDYQQALGLEDHELVDRALSGEWVPAKFLQDINESRLRQGLPLLVPPCHEYDEDKDRLEEIKKHAKEDFAHLRERAYIYLNELHEPETRELIIKNSKKSVPHRGEIDKSAEDIGRWFGQYIKDNGYLLDGGSPTTMKQMIMKAFPTITKDKEFTDENVDQVLLRFIAVANDYLAPPSRVGFTNAFAKSVVS